jgi:hypothetical protein
MKIFIILITFILSSCATIVSDSDYNLKISSQPNGANFIVKDKYNKTLYEGITPSNIVLESSDGYFKKAKYEIKFSKPGYQANNHYLKSDIDPWYYGNILIGGLIGFLIVDPITGAMYKLPESTNTTLYKKEDN